MVTEVSLLEQFCLNIYLNKNIITYIIFAVFSLQCAFQQKSLHVSFFCTIKFIQHASTVTCSRLALLDAPAAALTGAALEKQKEVVKTGKAALDKLLNESKRVLVKVTNKDDEVFKDLCLDTYFDTSSHIFSRFFTVLELL